MLRSLVGCSLLALLVSLPMFPSSAWSAPTAEQREAITSMWNKLKEADTLYKAGNRKQAYELVREVQPQLERFQDGGDATVKAAADRVQAGLKHLHAILNLEGYELAPLRAPGSVRDVPEPVKTPEPAPMPTPTPTPTPMPVADGKVSFSREVAPILASKCGGCHVGQSKGGFNTGTYAALMRGSDAGVVIFKGDADGSVLIESIVTGDMPRGGGKLTAGQLDTLKKWITEGAVFDGADPETPLARLTTAAAEPTPMVAVTKATGNEGVSFGRDIAPVLIKNCTSCHGARQPRGQFNMTTFERFLRGGASGAPVVPGNAMESLIVQKIKGMAGTRMPPPNAPALSSDTIAKFEKWVAEGAKFDGPAATDTLQRISSVVIAQTSSHDELSQARLEKAKNNWRLSLPSSQPDMVESKNFLLVGNVGEEVLNEVGEHAEKVAPEIGKFFNHPAGEPLIKGRMTIYVFGIRYDYSEFGNMVEKRQLPKEVRGHWRFDAVDTYGALLAPRNEETPMGGLVAQQLAGAYLASLGEVPEWFAEGSARALVARIDDTDNRNVEWDAQVADIVASQKGPDDFLNGGLPQEQANVAGYSFVKFLMTDMKRYNALIKQLREGKTFTLAFANNYGASPKQLTGAWALKAAKGSRRK